MTIPYSLLDLAPVPLGLTTADALHNTRDLAQHAERWGYTRYWLAEHHNMPGIASSATAVLIGHVAAATDKIRVGAGGIMLPNHAPLIVAEQFGTLAALYGDRIDLGVGRAPGTDAATMHALRRGRQPQDSFPQEVEELIAYLGPPDRRARVRAVPGAGTNVPVWILGSSHFGARLAAALGLPYAFASHFAPPALTSAFDLYRKGFRPTEKQERPYAMMAINVIAAETDEEARYLQSSVIQAFANLQRGCPGKLPPPVEDISAQLTPQMLSSVGEALSCSAVGSPETVRAQLEQLIASHRPDEVILTGQIHDHASRLDSFRIAAEAMRTFDA